MDNHAAGGRVSRGRDQSMSAKRKRSTPGAGGSAKRASSNSSGEQLSIRVLPAGQDGAEAEEEWPRKLQMPNEELQQSFAVAQLAVQLCALQSKELPKQWQAQDETHKRELLKAAHMPEELERLWKIREKQTDSRVKILKPEGFVPAAWRLLSAARQQVTRPVTDVE